MSHLDEKITTDNLLKLAKKFGNAFYLLDSEQFRINYNELKSAFQFVYPGFNIAYSYKTNYTPKLCKIVNELGGYAEVVSEMEMEIAMRCGVKASYIIWNGPVKNVSKIEELLIAGGTVNIDNLAEAYSVCRIAGKHQDKILNVGIRCNYDVGDGTLSRFGFDVNGEDFERICNLIVETPGIHLAGLQCHFANRKIEYWQARAQGMLKVYDCIKERYGLIPERIDIGGGIYGKMPETLSHQLGYEPPGYKAYAFSGASAFSQRFGADGPELLIEPGTALVGDCMRFVCRVENIKKIRDKNIATVTGSQKNISMSGINPPISVISGGREREDYTDIDIAGYTCIESDFLYKHYAGPLGQGDFVVISNCGSYSIVMKPPFILPNYPVVDISKGSDHVEIVKWAEGFDDLFHTFEF